MHLVFLTPLGALVGIGLVIPLAAALIRERRATRVRHTLGLAAPERRRALLRTAAIVSGVMLLAAAAAQPAISRRQYVHIRTDTAIYFVVDTSRSMTAAEGPGGRTRFERAIADAEQLRANLAAVPAGLAGFTDRVVPNLLPSTNRGDFTRTANEALAIDSPPPRNGSSRQATDLGALVAIATGNYFASRIRHRLVIAFTDGESEPFDGAVVAQGLRRAAVRLLVVRLWHQDERIYDQYGREDPGYSPDPLAGPQLFRLAQATGGAVYTEHELGAVAAAARHLLGRGPTMRESVGQRLDSLATYLIVAAAIPLAFLLLRRSRPSPTIELRPYEDDDGLDAELWPSRQHLGRLAPRASVEKASLPNVDA
jgi:VWA domain-containing protein